MLVFSPLLQWNVALNPAFGRVQCRSSSLSGPSCSEYAEFFTKMKQCGYFRKLKLQRIIAHDFIHAIRRLAPPSGLAAFEAAHLAYRVALKEAHCSTVLCINEYYKQRTVAIYLMTGASYIYDYDPCIYFMAVSV
ncbi:hypothetical protein T07_14166 [Trichinella nelsoni]|uniref:Uncharacterized protein n=1 Tax=Trichinella nelsoni TaxID=6336 RepID=A0A0V0RPU7_9BILA|nr:hypothetical protein T07_14166 [Trichinella nelsoni]